MTILIRFRKLFIFALALWTAASPLLADRPVAAAAPAGNIWLGVYPEGWITQTLINDELKALDAWSGKPTSIAGLFAEMDDPNVKNNIPGQLDLLWNNGYTPFINLQTGYFSTPTAAQIASGGLDAALNKWAAMFAGWATNGRWAFIAPLPEMNVPWVSYGRDPANYKLAFARIRSVFDQNNVPPSAVRWVFAPNGWDQLPFNLYYPGDNLVDVVGFSAFNDGFCPHPLHAGWHTPADLYSFPVQRLRQLAPGKPIFITRTGTTEYTGTGVQSASAKNQWLADAYNYLSNTLGVRAVIYYNYKLSSFDCDWAVFKKNTLQYSGYVSAVSNSSYGSKTPALLGAAALSPGVRTTYIPLVQNNSLKNKIPVMLGTYSQNWPGTQDVFTNEYHALDAWAGKPLSLAGTFIGIDTEPIANVEMELNVIWDNGYIPFINFSTYTATFTAKYIAQGSADSLLRGLAHSYRMALDGNPRRMAYIAPLEEMNGTHIPYGGDPTNFKLAYRRFKQIFAEEGVPAQSVRWVFAPNGNSPPGMPGFEAYYPGDSDVDATGLSAYNFGYCSAAQPSWAGWHPVAETYGTYISNMIALAPAKPLFIAQTGTSAYTAHGFDSNVKNAWLTEAYNYLVTFPQVKGVLYYNRWDADCDWAFYHKTGDKYIGYQQGAANPAYGVIPPYVIQDVVY